MSDENKLIIPGNNMRRFYNVLGTSTRSAAWGRTDVAITTLLNSANAEWLKSRFVSADTYVEPSPFFKVMLSAEYDKKAGGYVASLDSNQHEAFRIWFERIGDAGGAFHLVVRAWLLPNFFVFDGRYFPRNERDELMWEGALVDSTFSDNDLVTVGRKRIAIHSLGLEVAVGWNRAYDARYDFSSLSHIWIPHVRDAEDRFRAGGFQTITNCD